MIYVNSKYVLYQHSFTEVDTYFVFESNNKLQCKFISSRGGRHLHIDADGTGGLDVSPIQFCRRATPLEQATPIVSYPTPPAANYPTSKLPYQKATPPAEASHHRMSGSQRARENTKSADIRKWV